MILNERQLRTSQRKLREIDANVKSLEADASIDARDRRVAASSLKALAAGIRDEVAEYDALRSGAIRTSEVSLEELPLTLIRARIARGLTQAQLAVLLGMKEQQVQRYERTRYSGASLERLKEVADALGLEVQGRATVGAVKETAHRPIWRKPLILMALDSLEQRWRRAAHGGVEVQKLLVNADVQIRQQLGFHAFEFEPYRYGPYDPFVEDDIDYLAARDLIQKQVDLAATFGDEVLIAELRTVPLSTTKEGAAWVAAFERSDKVVSSDVKAAIREIVDRVVDEYGGLGVRDLIAKTYAEHPEMAARSEIREEMTERARKHGW